MLDLILCGEKIKITEQRIEQCKIYMDASQNARHYADLAKEAYEKDSKLDVCIINLLNFQDKYYQEAVKPYVQIINNHTGENSYTTLEYYTEASEYVHVLSDVIEMLAKSYSGLEVRDKYKKAQRELKKQYRDRFVGGGFGLTGAVKGMAMAGAANFASGLFHDISNGIGSIFDEVSSESDKKKIYEKGKDVIYETVYNDVFYMHYYLYQVLNKSICYTPEKNNEAEKIYKKIESGEGTENLKKLTIELITLAPYELKYFDVAIQVFKNNLNELAKYAQTMGNQEAYNKINDAQKHEDYIKNTFGPKAEEIKERYSEYLALYFLQYGGTLDIINGEKQFYDILVKNYNPSFSSWNIKFSQILPYGIIIPTKCHISPDEIPIFEFNDGSEGDDDNEILITTKNIYHIKLEKYIDLTDEKAEKIPISEIDDIGISRCFFRINQKGIFESKVSSEKDIIFINNLIVYILLKIKYNIGKIIPSKAQIFSTEETKKYLAPYFGSNSQYIAENYSDSMAIKVMTFESMAYHKDCENNAIFYTSIAVMRDDKKSTSFKLLYPRYHLDSIAILSRDKYYSGESILQKKLAAGSWYKFVRKMKANETILLAVLSAEYADIIWLFTDKAIYFETEKSKIKCIEYKDIKRFNFSVIEVGIFDAGSRFLINDDIVMRIDIASKDQAYILYNIILLTILECKYGLLGKEQTVAGAISTPNQNQVMPQREKKSLPEGQQESNRVATTSAHRKMNKKLYMALTLFGGWIGIHKFATGHWVWGLIFLCLVTTGIPFVISLITFVITIFKTPDNDGKINV